MGERKWMGIYIAVLVVLLVGPSLSSAAGPEVINESFVMGDTGCQMNIVLDGVTGGIVSADLGPAFEPPPSPSPTVYAFNFTGRVFAINPINWGSLPVPVAVDEIFYGTLTYDASSFIRYDVDAYSANYNPVPSTIFSINFAFANGQSFDFIKYSGGSVVNDRPVGAGLAGDSYNFQADVIPNPIPAGVDNVANMLLNLSDISGTALNGLDYPTNLSFGDWTETQFQFSLWSGEASQLVISGPLTSLYSADSPMVAVASHTVQQSATAPSWCTGALPPPEDISNTLVCKDCTGPDVNGIYTCAPENCEPKTAVERNIMEKSGDGSTYCYYDKLGRRVCKTI